MLGITLVIDLRWDLDAPDSIELDGAGFFYTAHQVICTTIQPPIVLRLSEEIDASKT